MKRKNTIVRSGGGLFTRTYKQLNIIRYYECGGGYFLLKKVSSTLIESEVADI